MPHTSSHDPLKQAKLSDEDREKLQGADLSLRKADFSLKGYIVAAIAICWSLFQLATASFLLLDTLVIKAVHLAFAIGLVFLTIPFSKLSEKLNSDSWRVRLRLTRIGILDICFGILASVCALYILIDYDGIAARSGVPIGRDLFFGVVLLLLMLEATRRVIGPALPIIATFFTLYIFTGPYLPDAIAFKGASLTRFVSQMTMATEGVYGVPLGVSATVVFLFVLFGSLLDRAGGGAFFIRLAISGLGQFRGGAAKAAVLASAFTGMVSGSSIANVVTAGTFTIPLMKKVGYPSHKAAAIEVAASVNGQLAPPVMGAAAFIIAEYVNVPYVEVAKAAAIPAFAAYAALLWITHIEACKLNLHGVPKSELPSFTQTFKEGFHYLIPVLLLLYELVVLQHSASLSVFRAILLLVAIIIAQPVIRARVRGTSMLRGLWFGFTELLGALASGGINMLSVAMATATAGIIVGCVSLGLGQQITSFVEVLSCGNIYLLLIITALASLLLGMGLPTTANYIIIASLTAPILVNLASGVTIHGMDIVVPLMAAHLFCFYFGIMADDTPPVGLAAYAGAAIASCSPIITGVQAFLYDIRTAILPLFFFFNHDIILWNIHSVPLGIFIYLMTAIACMAFGSLTQGWFFAKNTFLESLLLLFATVVMMYPYLLTGFFLPYEDRFWGYAAGLAALAMTWLLQRIRTGKILGNTGAATL